MPNALLPRHPVPTLNMLLVNGGWVICKPCGGFDCPELSQEVSRAWIQQSCTTA